MYTAVYAQINPSQAFVTGYYVSESVNIRYPKMQGALVKRGWHCTSIYMQGIQKSTLIRMRPEVLLCLQISKWIAGIGTAGGWAKQNLS